MSKNKGPWDDGRRAWERLNGWHQDAPSATPGHADDGNAALAALADVGTVRHLLDQAELVGVRTARRHGKSWAEIATKLGVARQSAWERWRDLDSTERWRDLDSAQRWGDLEGTGLDDAPSAAAEPSLSVPASVPTDIFERAANDLRRRSTTKVPSVIGMTWDEARHALLDKGLVGVGPDPDGPPLAAAGWPIGVVTDQSPESGAKVPTGSAVTLWIGRGGGSAGVREPRRPSPAPKAAREMRSDPSEEAIG
ncbi:MAG TPA: PASTA domain-containing protein [Acidothermaceae bacterium]|nr:PASTA domain-containing protein [Acidothermaceae bacterium]